MVAVLLAAAALVIPGGFHEVKPLEPAASFVAGKPVVVVCPNSAPDWASYIGPNAFDVGGATYAGGDLVTLAPVNCTALAKKPVIIDSRGARAILAITHEAIHARGEVDEGVTECTAMHEMPRVAVKFFGVKAGKQLRLLMYDAWQAHRAMPAEYTSVC